MDRLEFLNSAKTRDEIRRSELAQIATDTGTVPERLVTDVVALYLDEEARFLAAVEKGIAAAKQGEFIPAQKVRN